MLVVCCDLLMQSHCACCEDLQHECCTALRLRVMRGRLSTAHKPCISAQTTSGSLPLYCTKTQLRHSCFIVRCNCSMTELRTLQRGLNFLTLTRAHP